MADSGLHQLITSTNIIYQPMTTTETQTPASAALEQACTRLRSAGLRITQPRIAILSALIKRGEPATIEQIHLDLKDTACDLVTVYRCLAAFEDLGLVRRCFFHNGTSLYQIRLDDRPVYHVVSTEGAILDTIPSALADELHAVIGKVEAELKNRGLSNITHMAAFFVSNAAPQNSPVV